jgi:Right handed beta helix region
MRRITSLVYAVGLLVPLAVAPAHAQATRTWVSGVGNDADPCSRTAPCKTFAGAISKTAASGEINCLDPGGFGGVTITKSITISCEGVTAGVLATLGSSGVIVNAAAADVVYLKGLDFEGVNTGFHGIRFLAGSALFVDSCVIRDFNAVNGLGIAFTPSTNASMTIVNSIVHRNTNGGGIQVAPTGAGIAKVNLNNVTIAKNNVGIAAIGTLANTNVQIDNSTISANLSTGVLASGGATIRIGRSAIVNNAGAATSGNVLSYLDNQINGNTPDTVPVTAGGYH